MLPFRSLKTRVTVFSLTIFVASIWALAYYASNILQKDLQRMLGERQFTTATILADDVQQELEFRFTALQNVGAAIDSRMFARPAAVQAFLESKQILPVLFNGGYFTVRPDGVVNADFPPATGRIGLNFEGRGWLSEALAGRRAVGKPVIGPIMKVPVFTMAVPLRDEMGKVIGVLAGVVDLSKLDFLDVLTAKRFDKSGEYLLIAPQHRLIVTSSDKTRTLEPLSGPGKNQGWDKLVKGFEGYTIVVNPQGVEQLLAGKRIPVAGWYLAVTMPTSEVFAPIDRTRRHVALAALVVTLLAGGFTWRMLRREISPILDAVKNVSALSESDTPFETLPLAKQDEVGELIGAFNRLLTSLGLREAKLAASEERHRSILKTANSGILLIDGQGRLVEVNDAYCRMTGYSEAELLTMTVSDLDADESPEQTRETIGRIRERGGLRFETHHCRKDGHVLDVEVSAQYRPSDGETLVFVHDISERRAAEEERKRLEQQLLHAQKLESLGVLAGGIAHDFNNILMVMMGNAQLAMLRVKESSPASENLEAVLQAGERAADLAKQMLAYSGKGRFLIENVDLNKMLQEMGTMLHASISKKADLRLDLAPSLPLVQADITQLRQIVMNLVINASEAIGDNDGTIRVSTGECTCDNDCLNRVLAEENLPEGRYVHLEVSDTGCGMDEPTMHRVFDPFFTTKFTGRGLGMAAVLGIVRGHKGAIRIDSEPGRGTTFTVLFPASGASGHSIAPPVAEERVKSSGKVLLVDDEEAILNVGAQMLTELGFTPLTAGDGLQALDIFRNNPGISLVILDLTMPHMDGDQCFSELRQLDPGIRIIMSSGYSQQELAQKFADTGKVGFIQKPYTLAALSAAIRALEPGAIVSSAA